MLLTRSLKLRSMRRYDFGILNYFEYDYSLTHSLSHPQTYTHTHLIFFKLEPWNIGKSLFSLSKCQCSNCQLSKLKLFYTMWQNLILCIFIFSCRGKTKKWQKYFYLRQLQLNIAIILWKSLQIICISLCFIIYQIYRISFSSFIS